MPKRWFLCWVVNEFILGGGLVVFGCDFITRPGGGWWSVFDNQPAHVALINKKVSI